MTAVLADINLIVQATAFVILFISVMNAKKRNFPLHFKTAEFAASLLAISFLWMGYSFLNNIPVFILHPNAAGSLLAFAHAVSGILALFAALSFVFDRFIRKTFIPMRITFLLWTLAFLLGTAMYIIYYLY